MTALSPRNRASGFSLIELMIALVAGLIVSYAVVAFAMSSMKSNAEYVQSTKLTQSLRNTLDIVVRDMRRAGFDQGAVTRLAGGGASPAVGNSPFSPFLLDNTDATNGSCVIYAYDRPGTATEAGTLQVANHEVRGLRRRVVTPSNTGRTVGVIEYATSDTSKPTCAGATADYTTYPAVCNTTSQWCPLTDASTINITNFTVTETSATTLGSDPNAIRLRNMSIALDGRLVGDNGTSYLGVAQSYKRGLAATIKVRSDCVNTTIASCNVSP